MSPTYSQEDPARNSARGGVKSSLDIMGGLFLIGLAVLGFVGGFDLPFGTLSGVGSGLLPKVVAILVGVFGIVLIVQGLIWSGDPLERWHVRGPVFVLGAALIFAIVIRGSTLTLGGFAGMPEFASFRVPPLGLIVAGPLAVIFSSFAARDTRPVEIAVFAVVMTLLCGILFKELLHLPIPFDPAGLVPEPVNALYEGAKSAIGQVCTSIMNLIVG
jgi:hypothetical protein